MTAPPFRQDWRRRKYAAFDVRANSTAGRTITIDLWGTRREIYANANLSIYSAAACNGDCPFCIERLRPVSRGAQLADQKQVEFCDRRYVDALGQVLGALRPLDVSVSVTGGEPSKDPRLPAILVALAAQRMRKRTVTTNGSGLLDRRQGRPVVDWLAAAGVSHLNISRAHPDHDHNARLMALRDGLSPAGLRQAIGVARRGGVRVRLSCVLVSGSIDSIATVCDYLHFAEDLGVDNVVFRQLMLTDASTALPSAMTRFCDEHRVALDPILDGLETIPSFSFQKQILGYYYYVEVWRYHGIDVVLEQADLAQLETAKLRMPGIVHELVFHPNARLASTWKPWDGVLGPGAATGPLAKKSRERGDCRARPKPCRRCEAF